MQGHFSSHIRTARAIIGLLALTMLAVGCSWTGSPTAPQDPAETSRELWNPQPGDEIVPGRPVPLVNDGYWESQWGPSVNPLRLPIPRVDYLDEDGGTVALGGHSYVVPPDAIDEPTGFTLAIASVSGVGVDCGPSPFEFYLPVTIKLSYAGTQYDDGDGGYDPSALQLFYVTLDGRFIAMPSAVDQTLKTVSAQVDHFSRYIIG